VLKFEWDAAKEEENLAKHGIDFNLAELAFEDINRYVYSDLQHSQDEPRFFCLGKVRGKILTVRFTLRRDTIRIIGAGYWRKGEKIYEQQNQKTGNNYNCNGTKV